MELWILIPISAFAAVSWVIYIIVDGFRRRQQARMAADFHSKLLERIGSAQEFGEFLNTPGGAKFLDSLTIEREGGPHVRILRAVQTGLVLFVLGIGLFALFDALPYTIVDRPGERFVEERRNEGIVTLATISTSVGLGLLLSAGVSFSLSKRMGLINGESHRRDAATHTA
jgi:hypothetical protein